MKTGCLARNAKRPPAGYKDEKQHADKHIMESHIQTSPPRFPTVVVNESDGIRFLHLGGTAVQSAMRLSAPHDLELEYTRAMMGFLLFRSSAQEPACDIALIGLGGGSLAKFIYRHLPHGRITALEIDPAVVAAAREHFLLPGDDARLKVITGDGAAYVQAHPESCDVLLVDGFGAEHIADELTTAAFYRTCRATLKPGGIAVFNLWDSDQYFPRYFRNLSQAFDNHTLQLPAETKANIVVFAFCEPLPNTGFAHLSGRADRLHADIGLEFDDFLVRMAERNPCSEDGFIV